MRSTPTGDSDGYVTIFFMEKYSWRVKNESKAYFDVITAEQQLPV